MSEAKTVTAGDMIRQSLIETEGKDFHSNKWGERHVRAWQRGQDASRASQAAAIVRMVEAWAMYADAHSKRYEDLIGNDYVLGPQWKDAGMSIRALLDGEAGGLDCGVVSSLIVDIILSQGFTQEDIGV
jgi:hypothetical protein